MFEQLNFRVNFNRANYSSLNFTQGETNILRGLAEKVRAVSERGDMKEKAELWRRHNALERTRPLILCDPENGWNEIVPDETIQCVNSVARHWECHLRKQLFWGERMNDDYVVERFFNVPCVYEEKPWGVRGAEKQASKAYREDGGAYRIDTVLDDYGMLDKLTPPEYDIHRETTERTLALAHSVFDGILEVRLNTVWFWSVGMTDELAFLRGMEKLMFDFIDEPDGMHSAMRLFCEGTQRKLDFLEENGLFSLNNDGTYVGSGGMGFTGELPGNGFSGRVRARDLWGLAESQITVGVSPDTFGEFVWPYQKQVLSRFGLACYGCCEPLEKRFRYIRELPNLRRVSVSPWADREKMAELLGQDYIYSLKPSPTPLSTPIPDFGEAKAELERALRAARGACLEIIMKDNHTLGHRPENLTQWVTLAWEEIEKWA